MSIWTNILGAEVVIAEFGGVSTRVLEAGPVAGRPVILLHGRGGHLETFERNVSALADAGRRVIAFDLLGHGLTQHSGQRYDIGELLEHGRAVVTQLVRGARFDLIGQSLGGWVAALLWRANLNARRLVLIEPAGFQSEEARMADPEVRSAAERGGRAFDEVSTETVALRFEQLLADAASVDPEMVELRRRLYSIPGSTAVHKAVRAADNSRWVLDPDDWARDDRPRLILRGEHGHIPPELLERVAGESRGSLVTISRAKQWPHYENPTAVNTALLNFLEEER